MFENRCRRCNRKLKDPFALYGRVCAEKVGYQENDNSWYDVHDPFGSYLIHLRKEYNRHLNNSDDSDEDILIESRLVADIQKTLNVLGYTDNDKNQLEVTGEVDDKTDEAWSKYLDSQSKYDEVTPVGYESKKDFDLISDFAVIEALEKELGNHKISSEDRNSIASAIGKIKTGESSKFIKKNKIKISVDTVARQMKISDNMEKTNKFIGNFYLPSAVAAIGIDAMQNQWEEVGKDALGLAVSGIPMGNYEWIKPFVSYENGIKNNMLLPSSELIYSNDLIIDISLENSIHRKYVYNIYENTLKEIYNGTDRNEIIKDYKAPPNWTGVYGETEHKDFSYEKTYLRNDGKVFRESAGD